MTSPVMVHMTMLSKNTSNVPHSPWRGGMVGIGGGVRDGAPSPMPASCVNTAARHADAAGIHHRSTQKAPGSGRCR